MIGNGDGGVVSFERAVRHPLHGLDVAGGEVEVLDEDAALGVVDVGVGAAGEVEGGDGGEEGHDFQLVDQVAETGRFGGLVRGVEAEIDHRHCRHASGGDVGAAVWEAKAARLGGFHRQATELALEHALLEIFDFPHRVVVAIGA